MLLIFWDVAAGYMQVPDDILIACKRKPEDAPGVNVLLNLLVHLFGVKVHHAAAVEALHHNPFGVEHHLHDKHISDVAMHRQLSKASQSQQAKKIGIYPKARPCSPSTHSFGILACLHCSISRPGR